MVPLTAVPRPRAAARTTSRTSPTRAQAARRHARRARGRPRRRTSTPSKAPPGFTLLPPAPAVPQPDRATAARRSASSRATRTSSSGASLFVAGMWFQDLYNYDFRRTEMCIIPYGTQMGEISFCAYNTGVGWRNIIEKMKANATVAEWYRDQRAAPGLREEPGPAAARGERARS